MLRVEPADDSLEATAVLGDDGLTVFAVNRGEHAMALDLVVRDLGLALTEHLVLDGELGAVEHGGRPSGWRRAGSRAPSCPRDHGTCCG